MKKLVVLIVLLLVACNLLAQEFGDWKKIDKNFDSGIKQIVLKKYLDGRRDDGTNPFYVLTENNHLYYFYNTSTQGIELEFPDSVEINKIYSGFSTFWISTENQSFIQVIKELHGLKLSFLKRLEQSRISTLFIIIYI